MITKDGKIIPTVMRSFKIDEISGVDRPAQQKATVSIMKRAGEPTLSKGGMALTTMTGGHAHLVVMGGGDYERRAGMTDYVDDHAHPWLMDEAGNITIGHAMGHNHGIEIVAKNAGDSDAIEQILKGYGSADPKKDKKKKADKTAEPIGKQQDEDMTGEVKNKSADDAAAVEKKHKEELAKANARAERAEALAGLPLEHRKHFDGLKGDAAEAFLKADSTERAEVVRKANEANTVVYTDMDGNDYRKSDDPRLVTMAKGMDNEKKKRLESEMKAKKADLEKRAGDFPHIPGGQDAIVSLLKGIDSLPEAEREPALAALKAQNDRLETITKTIGTTDAAPVDPTGSMTKLDSMAAEIAKRDNITFAAAYSKALETPEGQKAYEEQINAAL